jgi:ParB family chromosome partitioning protein
MQRSDLTVYEQAQGFQMMLDLGESVVNIAKQTGFSDTTIRRRVKLLELDADKFKASEARGATLMDYVQLNEIEDVQRRNYLLEKLGTSDFKWEFNNALRAQNSKKNAPLFRKELESFATCITPDMPGSREYVKNLSASDYEPGKLIPKDAGTVKYFFTWNDEYYSSTLYKQSTRKEPTKRPQEEIDRENAIKKAKEDLYSVIKQAYEMRKNFFFGLSVTSKHIPDLLDFYASILLFNTH